MGRILFVSAALLALAHAAAAGPWMANTQTLAMHDPYQLNPVVSYDSVDDEYIVVWQEDNSPISEIYGVRVDTSGIVIDPGEMNNLWGSVEAEAVLPKLLAYLEQATRNPGQEVPNEASGGGHDGTY